MIVLAGATGELGRRIHKALLARGANVRTLVRERSLSSSTDFVADYSSIESLTQACRGAACVVSALSGLGDVIIKAQSNLLEGAVLGGVPRFIPSDFAADFLKLAPGENRNFDLRRRFHEILDRQPIRATSILNGAFADMLAGQAPFILFPLRKVLYWQDADVKLDFTTMDDTAAFTAAIALDPETPRVLRIAGSQVTARELAGIASEVRGERFTLLRAGSLKTLGKLIRLTRLLSFDKTAVFPAWQGMQYMANMYSGRAALRELDNDRYPEIKWTGVADVLRR